MLSFVLEVRTKKISATASIGPDSVSAFWSRSDLSRLEISEPEILRTNVVE
jgi:hypothetical protein